MAKKNMKKNYNLLQINAKQSKKKEAGLITVVNSQKNGKRVVLSHAVTKLLDLESTVKIALYGNALALSKDSQQITASFKLKDQGRKKVIYSSKLVDEIGLCLPLDFENCVSRTLYGYHYENINGEEILLIYEEECKFEEPDNWDDELEEE